MALFPDKLRLTNILVRGNLPRPEAEEFVETLAETVEPAATSDDVDRSIEPVRLEANAYRVQTDARFEALLAEHSADMRAMQAEREAWRREQRAEMQAMEARADARQAELEARMAQLEARIYRAVGVATALIIAAMSAWAAFG